MAQVKNVIGSIINKNVPPGFQITAKREFFAKIGIRQKRWGQIMRDEKPATIDEFVRISKYFGIPLSKLISKNEYSRIKSSL